MNTKIDKFYKKRYKILGGPGCGKTTEILKMLKNNFEAGLNFDQALMIGFAKATVENLQDRAQNDKKLSLFFTEKQAESIKTIHKFCKDHLKGYDIFNESAKSMFKSLIKTDPDNWPKLADSNYDGTDITAVGWSEEHDLKFGAIMNLIGLAKHSLGYEKALKIGNEYKIIKDPLERIYHFYDEDPSYQRVRFKKPEISYVYHNYEKFKNHYQMIDFDDMLEKSLVKNIEFKPYKLVLVDEAQDLSKLEWQVISKIARNTEELVLVGDDDQSIYGWKGSDARIFQKWPCKKECVRSLPKTYRLPPAIFNVVMKIQGEIQDRLGTRFECDPNKEGSFRFMHTLKHLNGSIKSTTDVIMCARTNTVAHNFKRYCVDHGLIFREKNYEHDKGTSFKTLFDQEKRKELILAWDTLQKGGQIQGKQYLAMVKKLKPNLIEYGKKGALEHSDTQPPELQDPDLYLSYEDLKNKYYFLGDINEPWHEVFKFETTRKLFRDNEHFNNYLRDCWEKDPTLESNIKVAAIHSVKGMEADIVIVDADWGPNSIKSYNSGDKRKEDEETRVAYVATSRPKKHLVIYQHDLKIKNRFPLLTHEFLQ
jgi:superfamily I DNA/RNA helicase